MTETPTDDGDDLAEFAANLQAAVGYLHAVEPHAPNLPPVYVQPRRTTPGVPIGVDEFVRNATTMLPQLVRFPR